MTYWLDEIAGKIDRACDRHLHDVAILLYCGIFVIGAHMLGGL